MQRSVLTENRDSDLSRFLHVVPTGQPVVELAIKLGIFVFLKQLCFQNTPQGVQTTRLYDLGRLNVDPWTGRKGTRAWPQPHLQPTQVSSTVGRGNLKGARYKWQAETLQPNTFIARYLQTLTCGHTYKDVYK